MKFPGLPILIFAVLMRPNVILCQNCRPGFKEVMGQCIFYSSDKLSQENAENSCRNIGAQLYEPRSNSKFVAIVANAGTKKEYWVGLTKDHPGADFKYVSNSEKPVNNEVLLGTERNHPVDKKFRYICQDLAPLIPDQLFLSFNRNGIGVVGLDLTESLDCTFDYENPKQITLDSQNWWHNYGGVMSGDKVVACGDQSCYSLTQEAGLDFVASLSMSREFAAAITINDDTLFVAGGRIEGRSVTISDFIRPGQVPASVPGPELPYPVDGHCFVKINETTAYLFGGLDETDFETNKTAFYDIANNRFIEGEPRNIKQYDAACQLLVIDGVSYVVAIGGEGEEKGKCWVWNSITESWKNEEPIFDYDPVDAGIIKANGVDNGFFIFGGYTDLQEDTLPAIYFVTYDPISGFTSQLLEQRLPWDFSTYVELPDSWKKDVTCIETTYQGE